MPTERDQFLCPHCRRNIPDEAMRTLVGRWMSAQRVAPAGPPKVERRCEFCGKPQSARQMRLHIPRCYSNPNATKLACPHCKKDGFSFGELVGHMSNCSSNPKNKKNRRRS